MNKNFDYYMGLDYPVVIHQIPEEDGGGYLAKVVDLEWCMADGETKMEALENVEISKADYLEFCLEEGIRIDEPKQNEDKEYSGRFTVRVPKTMHKQLTNKAEEENVSLNTLVINYISSGLSQENTIKTFSAYLKEQIGQGPQISNFMNVFDASEVIRGAVNVVQSFHVEKNPNDSIRYIKKNSIPSSDNDFFKKAWRRENNIISQDKRHLEESH